MFPIREASNLISVKKLRFIRTSQKPKYIHLNTLDFLAGFLIDPL